MSSFTTRLTVTAIQGNTLDWKRFLPPGFQRPRWMVAVGFEYAIGDLDAPDEVISVPANFVFDGASVPLLLRMLVPMAHPDYIQAAALHDWMLGSRLYTRGYCDQVFYEALGVLGMPTIWRIGMYGGVSLGTARSHARKLIARHL